MPSKTYPETNYKAAVLQYGAKGTPAETLPVMEGLIRQAAGQGARLICLPECASFLAADKQSLTFYAEEEAHSPTLKSLQTWAQTHAAVISVGSLMMRVPGTDKIANRGYLIGRTGEILTSYDKIHLFDAQLGDRNYRESDDFQAGHKLVSMPTELGHIGLSICYDLRFPHLYRQLAQRGAQIIVIPAAFTRITGAAHWHVLQRARAIETGCFILSAAQYGTHADGRKTFGHSLIINPWGEILAEAGEQTSGFVLADIDLMQIQHARQKIASLSHNPEFS